MPHQILFSVEAEGMNVEELPLSWLHSIEKVDTVSGTGVQTVRLTATTIHGLYLYIGQHWGNYEYAGQVVYDDEGWRSFTAWDLAR